MITQFFKGAACLRAHGFNDPVIDAYNPYLKAYWPLTDNPGLYDEDGKVVTPYSEGHIDLVTKKLGTGSLSWDNGLRLWAADSADWDVGAGDFTIDCWVKTTGQNGFIYNRIDDSTNGIELFIDGAGGFPRVYCGNGSTWFVTSGAWAVSVTDGNWHHVALVRSGDNWIGFVDGVVRWSATISGTVGNPANRKANIGVYTSDDSSYNYYFGNGSNMDEFRFSKGIARWTADFSGSLPAANYAMDSYTKLLLHFDTGNPYLDSVGANNLTNDHLVQQSVGKHGNAAVFDRHNQDRLYIPVNADFSPTDKLTVAYWVKHNSFTGEQYHCTIRGATTSLLFMDAYTAGRYMYSIWQSDGTQKYEDIATPFANTGQWYHAAMVCDGSYVRMYCNGSPVGTPIAYNDTLAVASGAPCSLNFGTSPTPSGFADIVVCEAGFWNGAGLSAAAITNLASGKYYS